MSGISCVCVPYLRVEPTRFIPMEIGTLKEGENRLKNDIIINLERQFIDLFEKWKQRQELLNEVVLQYNKTHKKRFKGLSYDEFCRLFIKGSEGVLEEFIRMEDIVPDPKEVEAIRANMENKDDADEFTKRYTLILEIKYARVKMNMAQVWDERVFCSIVSERYGAEHYAGMVVAKGEVISK